MYNIFELVISVILAISGLAGIYYIFYTKFKQEYNIWENFKGADIQ